MHVVSLVIWKFFKNENGEGDFGEIGSRRSRIDLDKPTRECEWPLLYKQIGSTYCDVIVIERSRFLKAVASQLSLSSWLSIVGFELRTSGSMPDAVITLMFLIKFGWCIIRSYKLIWLQLSKFVNNTEIKIHFYGNSVGYCHLSFIEGKINCLVPWMNKQLLKNADWIPEHVYDN